jgi:hypothetical protein
VKPTATIRTDDVDHAGERRTPYRASREPSRRSRTS